MYFIIWQIQTQFCWIFKTSMRPAWIHYFRFDLIFRWPCVPMTTLSHIQLDKSLLRNLKLKLIYLDDTSNNHFKKTETIANATENVLSSNGSNTLKWLFKAPTSFSNVAGTIKKRENRLHYRVNTILHGFNTLRWLFKVPKCFSNVAWSISALPTCIQKHLFFVFNFKVLY